MLSAFIKVWLFDMLRLRVELRNYITESRSKDIDNVLIGEGVPKPGGMGGYIPPII